LFRVAVNPVDLVLLITAVLWNVQCSAASNCCTAFSVLNCSNCWWDCTRGSRHILLGPASNFTRPRNIFTRGQQTILLGPGIAVDIYTGGQQIILPGSSKQFY